MRWPCTQLGLIRRAGARPALAAVLLALSCLVPACGLGSSPEDARRLGDEHMAAERFPDAIAAYRTALAANPADVETRRKLRDAYLRAQRWPEATDEAIRTADLRPDDLDAQRLAVELMVASGLYRDGLDRVTALLEKHPDDAGLLIQFGNATAQLANPRFALDRIDEALRAGQSYYMGRSGLRPPTHPSDADEAAEKAFNRARELRPDWGDPLFALANVYWASDRLDEAEEPLRVLAEGGRDVLSQRLLGFYYEMRGRDEPAERYFRMAAENPNGGPSREVLGRYLMRKERYRDALTVLVPLLAEDWSTPLAVEIAEAEMRLGDAASAARHAEQVLQRERGNVRALTVKAQGLLASGALDQVITLLRDTVQGTPGAVGARLVLGTALRRQGSVEEAFEQYSEALRREPDNAEAPVALADLALQLGRPQQAVVFGREAMRKSPQNREARLVLSRALVATGALSEAETTLRPLLSATPPPPALIALGHLQAARRNTAAARASYAAALQGEPGSLEALASLVALDIETKNFTAARARIAAAPAQESPGVMLLAARVSLAQGERQNALDGLRKIVAANPAHLNATLTLASVLADAARLDEARQVLEQYLTVRSTSIEAQLALGRVFEALGQQPRAQRIYEAVLASDPEVGFAAYRLAAIHLASGGNLTLALTLASSAKRQMPEDPDVNHILGWIYSRMGMAERGVPFLEEAIRAAPSVPSYRYHAGATYVEAGQLLKARREFEQALALGPELPEAAEAQAALRWLPR